MNKLTKFGLAGGATLVALMVGAIGVKHVKLSLANDYILEHQNAFNSKNESFSLFTQFDSTLMGNETITQTIKSKATNNDLFKIVAQLKPHALKDEATLSGDIISNITPDMPFTVNGNNLGSLNGTVNSSGSQINLRINEVIYHSDINDKTNNEKNYTLMPFNGQINVTLGDGTVKSTFNNINVMGTKEKSKTNEQYKLINNLNFSTDTNSSSDNKSVKVAAIMDGINFYTKIGSINVGKSQMALDFSSAAGIVTNKNYIDLTGIKSNLIRGMEYNTSSFSLSTFANFNSSSIVGDDKIVDGLKSIITKGATFRIDNLKYKSLLGEFDAKGSITTVPSKGNGQYLASNNVKIDVYSHMDQRFLASAQPYLRNLTELKSDFTANDIEGHFANGVASSNPNLPGLNSTLVSIVDGIGTILGNPKIQTATKPTSVNETTQNPNNVTQTNNPITAIPYDKPAVNNDFYTNK